LERCEADLLSIALVLLARGPAAHVVRNRQPAVKGALEGAEAARARGGGLETHIEAHRERPRAVLLLLHLLGERSV